MYYLFIGGAKIDVFNNLFQVVSTFILSGVGALISLLFSRVFNVNYKIGISLYIYHLFFGLVYFIYVANFGGDAIGYYVSSLEVELRDFRPGTIAIEHLTAVFSSSGLSAVGVFTIYNIFGFVGLFAFYACLDEVTRYSSHRLKQLVILIVFLPSISFWSAGLGKDAISFMAMGLALFAALDFARRIPLLVLAIAFMLFVRPHMAGMMLIAVVISVVLSKQVPFIPRLLVGSIGLVISASMIPFALNYAGVSEDASNLGEYIDKRASYNTEGGGGVDIASMPLPLQMFTYMFRPLPLEARSITQLLASIDNMILLYLSYVAFKARATVRNLTLPGNRVFMWWYVLIAWVLLSMTTANLGIAMRQKWMFAPVLIFLLISIIAASENKNKQ